MLEQTRASGRPSLPLWFPGIWAPVNFGLGAYKNGKEAFMFPYEFAHIVRADQLEQAAFQRWLRRVGPLQRGQERPERRLPARIRAWLERYAHPVRCEPSQPACGLSLTA
jgi:hypothetical protein